MLIDARLIAPETELVANLCIVGGGPAGMALAREFIGSPLRVCLLESGGLEPDIETQSLDAGENVGFPYYPLHSSSSRSLGGSSVRWHVPLGRDRVGARMRPLDPIDFERRDWVPYSGWPFGREHLEPYYDRAQTLCRIQPSTFGVADWDDGERCPRAAPVEPNVQTILYKFCEREVFARDYPNKLVGAGNISACLHANVLEIESNDRADHITRVRVATLAGNQFFVRATVFILAAGGIGTPRLMLLSSKKQAVGLANQNDLVGRFFMEHLHFWSGMLVPHDPSLFNRTALYNGIYTVGDVAVIRKLALCEHVLRRERLLNHNIQLMPDHRPDPFKYRPLDEKPKNALKALVNGTARDAGEHIRSIVTGLDDIARAAIRRWRGAFPTKPVFIFANMTEQAPNPQSRVTLGQDLDVFGQRRVQLDWKITSQDISSAVRTQEIIGSALETIGWGRFHRELVEDVPPEGTHGGYHHMGTTRMHSDSKQGVVDPDGRVHGIDNLYIAGPSVFPTAGYANPVLTTLALSLRLADHLKVVLNSRFRRVTIAGSGAVEKNGQIIAAAQEPRY